MKYVKPTKKQNKNNTIRGRRPPPRTPYPPLAREWKIVEFLLPDEENAALYGCTSCVCTVLDMIDVYPFPERLLFMSP